MITKDTKIVCLGGGIGTVNLIRGLKDYTDNITVVLSLADEGGSAGRLRRLYKMYPPGDLVSCMAAFMDNDNPLLSKLLTYRFPGNRYGQDGDLGGHKLGNLMAAAMHNSLGSFEEVVKGFKNLFHIKGAFYPATIRPVTISAKTVEGQVIKGEEAIDLGKYSGKRVLEHVYLHPKNARAPKEVLEAMEEADLIIAGPGDLFTTILPVLIVDEITRALKESKAKKIFVVNIANKPFETKNYALQDYVKAIVNHLGNFPFEKIILNSNFEVTIPMKYRYSFVKRGNFELDKISVAETDLVNEKFPLYHSSHKLAKAVSEQV